MKIKQIKEEKTCENCRNCWSAYVCKQHEIDIEERKPCNKYYQIPKPITVKELIIILETLPQDSPVTVDAEGYFAVVGASTNEDEDNVNIDLDLISW